MFGFLHTILQIINDHLFSISPKPTRLIKTPTFPNQYLSCLIILPVISHSETRHFLPLNHSNPPNIFSLLISFFLFFKVSQPGTEPAPSAVEVKSPNHWTAREFPSRKIKKLIFLIASFSPKKDDQLFYFQPLTPLTHNESTLDETRILWPPDGKSGFIWKDPDAGKDWRQEEKGMTENEIVGWHHWLKGHEFE